MSKILSITTLALFFCGAIFILLRLLGRVNWHWVWVVSPILLAVSLYVIIFVIAVVLGLGVQ